MKYLVLVALFWSCTDISTKRPDTNLSVRLPAPIDTANTMAYHVASYPAVFETAFFKAAQEKVEEQMVSFYPVDIGKIKIETGKIVACDPIVMQNASPFVQTFPTGNFPVQLAIAKINSDERVAFSRIFFSENPVAKWEFALLEGQQKIPVGSDSIYGYGVDGGIALYTDEAANKAFNKTTADNFKAWSDVFTDSMENNSRTTWQYVLYEFEEHSLASFTTGYGDGFYATYIGYDDKGNICRLLSDFGIVNWWKGK